MKNFKIGEPIKTSLSNSILIGVYGHDAIIYSNSDDYEQYVYAHNIEYYEKENKYVWSSGDYYASLEECMIQVIANKKEVFYDLLDYTQKLHYSTYIKGIVKIEKEIEDENILDSVYDAYMENDNISLLNEEFDYVIDELREKTATQEKDKDLVNIVGNIVGDVHIVGAINKDGEAFKVANFSIVSNDENGNKFYTKCSAYGEKSDIPKEFKQGDFVKVFGKIKTSIDENGKEYSNVRVLSSKLLKAKEQMKTIEKESLLEKAPITSKEKEYER